MSSDDDDDSRSTQHVGDDDDDTTQTQAYPASLTSSSPASRGRRTRSRLPPAPASPVSGMYNPHLSSIHSDFFFM
jgi:hypothetical protein